MACRGALPIAGRSDAHLAKKRVTIRSKLHSHAVTPVVRFFSSGAAMRLWSSLLVLIVLASAVVAAAALPQHRRSGAQTSRRSAVRATASAAQSAIRIPDHPEFLRDIAPILDRS